MGLTVQSVLKAKFDLMSAFNFYPTWGSDSKVSYRPDRVIKQIDSNSQNIFHFCLILPEFPLSQPSCPNFSQMPLILSIFLIYSSSALSFMYFYFPQKVPGISLFISQNRSDTAFLAFICTVHQQTLCVVLYVGDAVCIRLKYSFGAQETQTVCIWGQWKKKPIEQDPKPVLDITHRILCARHRVKVRMESCSVAL